jgi:hypothetical protein
MQHLLYQGGGKTKKKENEKSLMSNVKMSKSRASNEFTLEVRDFGFLFNNNLDGRRACQPCQDVFSIPATCCRLSATKL